VSAIVAFRDDACGLILHIAMQLEKQWHGLDKRFSRGGDFGAVQWVCEWPVCCGEHALEHRIQIQRHYRSA
jgi:hypothetical protein